VIRALYPYFIAARPKTLVAAGVGVLVGASFGLNPSSLGSWLTFLGCLLFATLIQVATNFYNEYYDFLSGADENRELAPVRLVASGMISPLKIRNFANFLMGFAFLVGGLTVLYAQASWLYLPFGMICIASGYCYTGGPFPLAYRGLGDVFVILFFGLGSVLGTYHLLTIGESENLGIVTIIGFSLGLVINNLLVVNNYRDFENDKLVEKNTSIVLLGKKFGLFLFLVGILFPPLFCILANQSFWPLSFTIILGLFNFRKLVAAESKCDFDFVLKLSALNVLITGVSMASLIFKNYS
jgi:1,4-dihydroxy-2-naphthoate octaprenyltransferase